MVEPGPLVARQVADAIRNGEGEKRFYELQAWVIMPNHVHVLLLPRVELPQRLIGSKGESACLKIVNMAAMKLWKPSFFRASTAHRAHGLKPIWAESANLPASDLRTPLSRRPREASPQTR